MKLVLNALKGVAIGIATIIPGVSGGTIAFITGIYEELMESIGSFFKNKEKRKQYFVFLLTIVVAAGIGIVLFNQLLRYLLENHHQATYLFFFGLIAGSIPLILKAHHDMKFSLPRGLSLVLGAALVIGLILISGDKGEATRQFTVTHTIAGFIQVTPIDWKYALWIAFCGILAAGSMIIPGFSGSALMVTMGEYANISYFIDQFMIVPLFFLGVGSVIGILLIARLIDVALKKIPALTFYFILGLILGSFVQIIKEVLPGFDASALAILISVLSAGAGFALSFFMSKIEVKKA